MNYVPETTAHAEPTQHRHWGVTLLWLTPVLLLLTIVVYGMLTRPPTSLDDPAPFRGRFFHKYKFFNDLRLCKKYPDKVQLYNLRLNGINHLQGAATSLSEYLACLTQKNLPLKEPSPPRGEGVLSTE